MASRAASAGYQWVNGKRGFGDQKDWIYGLGVEVGPKDIGLGGVTSNSGVRLRLQMNTYDFDSLRLMAGVIVLNIIVGIVGALILLAIVNLVRRNSVR